MIHHFLPSISVSIVVGLTFSLFITPTFAEKLDTPALSISSPSDTQGSDLKNSDKKKTSKIEPKVIIYSAEFCSYCTSAKELLDAKNVKYEVIDVQGQKHLIDEMEKVTGKRTVPQIIVNGKHVGSYMSLVGANLTGELDELLKVKEE